MSSRGLQSYRHTLFALSTNYTSSFLVQSLHSNKLIHCFSHILYTRSRSRITTIPLSEAISRQPSHQSLCERPDPHLSVVCPPSVKASHANHSTQPCPPRTGVVRPCDTTEENQTQNCLDGQFVRCAKLSGDCGGGACCYLRSTVYLTLFVPLLVSAASLLSGHFSTLV